MGRYQHGIWSLDDKELVVFGGLAGPTPGTATLRNDFYTFGPLNSSDPPIWRALPTDAYITPRRGFYYESGDPLLLRGGYTGVDGRADRSMWILRGENATLRWVYAFDSEVSLKTLEVDAARVEFFDAVTAASDVSVVLAPSAVSILSLLGRVPRWGSFVPTNYVLVEPVSDHPPYIAPVAPAPAAYLALSIPPYPARRALGSAVALLLPGGESLVVCVGGVPDPEPAGPPEPAMLPWAITMNTNPTTLAVANLAWLPLLPSAGVTPKPRHSAILLVSDALSDTADVARLLLVFGLALGSSNAATGGVIPEIWALNINLTAVAAAAAAPPPAAARRGMAEWELLYLQPATATERVPRTRVGAAAVMAGGVMYLFGGRVGTTLFNDLWGFDLARRVWLCFSPLETVPEARVGHVASTLDAGVSVLVGFGESPRGTAAPVPLNDLWILTYLPLSSSGAPPEPGQCPASSTMWHAVLFTPDSRLPRGRFGATLDVVGSFGLLFGGYVGDGGAATAELWAFNWHTPNFWTWEIVPPDPVAPPARYGHASVASGSNLFIAGGSRERGGAEARVDSAVGDLWVFDVLSLTWTQVVSANNPGRALLSYRGVLIFDGTSVPGTAIVYYATAAAPATSQEELCGVVAYTLSSSTWQLANASTALCSAYALPPIAATAAVAAELDAVDGVAMAVAGTHVFALGGLSTEATATAAFTHTQLLTPGQSLPPSALAPAVLDVWDAPAGSPNGARGPARTAWATMTPLTSTSVLVVGGAAAAEYDNGGGFVAASPAVWVGTLAIPVCAGGDYRAGSTCLPCGEGEGADLGSDCVACPENTFSSAADVSCIECPPGRKSNRNSPSMLHCSFCPNGTYRPAGALSSSPQCLPCDAGAHCPVGSGFQLARAALLAALGPLSTTLPPPAVDSPPRVPLAVYLGLGCGALAVVLTLGLVLYLFRERLRGCLVVADVFSDKHITKPGHVLRDRRTPAGGVFTVLALVGVVVFLGVMTAQFLLGDNTDVASAVTPLWRLSATMPPPLDEQMLWPIRLEVTVGMPFLNISEDDCNRCVGLSVVSTASPSPRVGGAANWSCAFSPFPLSVQRAASPPVGRVLGTCEVRWVCAGCAQTTDFSLRVTASLAREPWATPLDVTGVMVPAVVVNCSALSGFFDTPSGFSRVLAAPDGAVLSGQAESRVDVQLMPTVFRDTRMLQSASGAGASLVLRSAVVNGATDSPGLRGGGVSVGVYFSRADVGVLYEWKPRVSALSFAASVLGSVPGVIAIFAILLGVYEKVRSRILPKVLGQEENPSAEDRQQAVIASLVAGTLDTRTRSAALSAIGPPPHHTTPPSAPPPPLADTRGLELPKISVTGPGVPTGGGVGGGGGPPLKCSTCGTFGPAHTVCELCGTLVLPASKKRR